MLVLVQPCRKIARSVTAGAKLTLRVEAGHSSGDGAGCGHEANVRRRLRRTVLGRVSDHCPGEGTATELLHSSGAQLGCTIRMHPQLHAGCAILSCQHPAAPCNSHPCALRHRSSSSAPTSPSTAAPRRHEHVPAAICRDYEREIIAAGIAAVILLHRDALARAPGTIPGKVTRPPAAAAAATLHPDKRRGFRPQVYAACLLLGEDCARAQCRHSQR